MIIIIILYILIIGLIIDYIIYKYITKKYLDEIEYELREVYFHLKALSELNDSYGDELTKLNEKNNLEIGSYFENNRSFTHILPKQKTFKMLITNNMLNVLTDISMKLRE